MSWASLLKALPCPISLSSRCEFCSGPPPECAITVLLGQTSFFSSGVAIVGDVRGSELSYGCLLSSSEPAHPITSCALAGYLGFSVLEHAVGIPPFREEWRQEALRLPFDDSTNTLPSFSVLGTGQVGQAFLALAYFLAADGGGRPPAR